MCLFMGMGGKRRLRLGGGVGGGGGWSVIYGMPFGSWGKILPGRCLVSYSIYNINLFYFTLLCFSLSNVFYIFMYILTGATNSVK